MERWLLYTVIAALDELKLLEPPDVCEPLAGMLKTENIFMVRTKTNLSLIHI